ncbi:dienelactone hydrolase family protein [Arthrobacter sp. A5]|uniref:dienelactone hydrolase family protein n=1 Tax=Arthrobacter sp. A5 TaxID=576926 RepID=UPI003DA7BD8C
MKDSMQEADVAFTAVVHPDAGHAFFNDSNKCAYRQGAADDAWQKTLAFLSAALEA